MSDKTNCLFCNGEGCTFCHPPKHEWFAAGSASKFQRKNFRRGLHPMGARLATNGKRCGSCKHHIKLTSDLTGNNFHKCDLNWTNSPATDIRVTWPACVQYEDDGGVPF